MLAPSLRLVAIITAGYSTSTLWVGNMGYLTRAFASAILVNYHVIADDEGWATPVAGTPTLAMWIYVLFKN